VIQGRSLTLDEGATLAAFSQSQGNAGRVVIHVTGPLVLTEDATIFDTIDEADPIAIGTTGGVFLDAGTLAITNGAELIVNTNGIGDVGDIVIRVRGSARLSGIGSDASGIFNVVRSNAIGNAGDIRLSARSLSITGGARLQAETTGQGNAGNIRLRVRDRLLLNATPSSTQDSTGLFTAVGTGGNGRGGDIDIRAGTLSVLNGAQLSASTFEHGDAGTITIQVRGQATFDGSNHNSETAGDRVRSGILSIVGEDVLGGTIPAIGNGGNIRLSAHQVALRNGATLATAVTSNSHGNAGRITVTAADRVLIDGRDSDGDVSSIETQVNPGAVGNASDIRITTDRLTISNSGFLQASIGGQGEAGNIRIHSRSLDLLSGGRLLTTTAGSSSAGNINLQVGDRTTVSGRQSGLFASTETGATGQGGDINVTTHQLSVSDRANITVSSPTGRAGNLTIAANRINLDQGRLTAEAGAGSGAQITLQNLNSLLLQNNSLISAQAFANATGGNVTMNAPAGFVIGIPEQNSDIIASASRGRGGNISITAQGIFAIEQQRSQPPNQTNDIDASSQFSQSGTVTINQPDVDPSRGLVELPTNLVDRSTQIARGCSSRHGESSRFVAVGRGGLPLSPDQLLRDRTILAPDWVTLDVEPEGLPVDNSQRLNQGHLEQATPSDATIVEADGFKEDINGDVVLVAQSQVNNAIHSPIGDRTCLER
jgi:large exoprotein involved in heme utilization and adhesion